MSDNTLNVLTPKRLTKLIGYINNDEEFRFGRIKPSAKPGKIDVPAPTDDDNENTESVKSFRCAVIAARPNFYRDAQKPLEEPKERTEIHLLREGQEIPELLYLPPTSTPKFKQWVTAAAKKGQSIWNLLATFEGEKVTSKNTGFTWTIINCTTAGSLTDDEIEMVETLRQPIMDRVARYTREEVDDELYQQALSGVRTANPDESAKVATARAREALKATNGTKEAEPEAPKPVSKPAPVVEEVPEVKPDSKPERRKAPSLDDDDDEDDGEVEGVTEATPEPVTPPTRTRAPRTPATPPTRSARTRVASPLDDDDDE